MTASEKMQMLNMLHNSELLYLCFVVFLGKEKGLEERGDVLGLHFGGRKWSLFAHLQKNKIMTHQVDSRISVTPHCLYTVMSL